jgi:hypothetical protein
MTVPKMGNVSSENEDTFFTHKNGPITKLDSPFTCAISDGATAATFSKLWASILVKTFSRAIPDPNGFQTNLDKCQLEWKKHFQQRELPWHTEEKMKMGSFATLLWLTIFPHETSQKPGGRFKALCVGDSCIFQVRNQKVIFCKPIGNSADFNNRPALIPSLSSLNHFLKMDSSVQIFSNDWQRGDQLLLTTDALAAFLIKKMEEGSGMVSEFFDLLGRSGFEGQVFSNWVDQQRAENTLRNDDTSLTSITIQ